MSTVPSLPAPEGESLTDEETLAAEQALLAANQAAAGGRFLNLSPVLARLPVQLDVTIPVREFRVRNLLSLEAGQVVETDWAHGEDMPLASGKVPLAWSEFEVVDTALAVRVTRLT
jgi:flagellar motor switch protein FliM